jgi:hypothetical protein
MNVRLGSATTIPLADCGEILAVADVAAADSRSRSAVASEVTDQERRLPLAVSVWSALQPAAYYRQCRHYCRRRTYSTEIQLLAHC